MSKRNNKGKSSRGRGGGGAGGGGYGKPHPYGLPDLTRAAKIPVQNTRLVPNAWPVTIGPGTDHVYVRSLAVKDNHPSADHLLPNKEIAGRTLAAYGSDAAKPFREYLVITIPAWAMKPDAQTWGDLNLQSGNDRNVGVLQSLSFFLKAVENARVEDGGTVTVYGEAILFDTEGLRVVRTPEERAARPYGPTLEELQRTVFLRSNVAGYRLWAVFGDGCYGPEAAMRRTLIRNQAAARIMTPRMLTVKLDCALSPFLEDREEAVRDAVQKLLAEEEEEKRDKKRAKNFEGGGKRVAHKLVVHEAGDDDDGDGEAEEEDGLLGGDKPMGDRGLDEERMTKLVMDCVAEPMKPSDTLSFDNLYTTDILNQHAPIVTMERYVRRVLMPMHTMMNNYSDDRLAMMIGEFNSQWSDSILMPEAGKFHPEDDSHFWGVRQIFSFEGSDVILVNLQLGIDDRRILQPGSVQLDPTLYGVYQDTLHFPIPQCVWKLNGPFDPAQLLNQRVPWASNHFERALRNLIREVRSQEMVAQEEFRAITKSYEPINVEETMEAAATLLATRRDGSRVVLPPDHEATQMAIDRKIQQFRSKFGASNTVAERSTKEILKHEMELDEQVNSSLLPMDEFDMMERNAEYITEAQAIAAATSKSGVLKEEVLNQLQPVGIKYRRMWRITENYMQRLQPPPQLGLILAEDVENYRYVRLCELHRLFETDLYDDIMGTINNGRDITDVHAAMYETLGKQGKAVFYRRFGIAPTLSVASNGMINKLLLLSATLNLQNCYLRFIDYQVMSLQASDLQVRAGLHMGMYGAPGVGKSYVADMFMLIALKGSAKGLDHQSAKAEYTNNLGGGYIGHRDEALPQYRNHTAKYQAANEAQIRELKQNLTTLMRNSQRYMSTDDGSPASMHDIRKPHIVIESFCANGLKISPQADLALLNRFVLHCVLPREDAPIRTTDRVTDTATEARETRYQDLADEFRQNQAIGTFLVLAARTGLINSVSLELLRLEQSAAITDVAPWFPAFAISTRSNLRQFSFANIIIFMNAVYTVFGSESSPLIEWSEDLARIKTLRPAYMNQLHRLMGPYLYANLEVSKLMLTRMITIEYPFDYYAVLRWIAAHECHFRRSTMKPVYRNGKIFLIDDAVDIRRQQRDDPALPWFIQELLDDELDLDNRVADANPLDRCDIKPWFANREPGRGNSDLGSEEKAQHYQHMAQAMGSAKEAAKSFAGSKDLAVADPNWLTTNSSIEQIAAIAQTYLRRRFQTDAAVISTLLQHCQVKKVRVPRFAPVQNHPGANCPLNLLKFEKDPTDHHRERILYEEQDMVRQVIIGGRPVMQINVGALMCPPQYLLYMMLTAGENKHTRSRDIVIPLEVERHPSLLQRWTIRQRKVPFTVFNKTAATGPMLRRLRAMEGPSSQKFLEDVSVLQHVFTEDPEYVCYRNHMRNLYQMPDYYDWLSSLRATVRGQLFIEENGLEVTGRPTSEQMKFMFEHWIGNHSAAPGRAEHRVNELYSRSAEFMATRDSISDKIYPDHDVLHNDVLEMILPVVIEHRVFLLYKDGSMNDNELMGSYNHAKNFHKILMLKLATEWFREVVELVPVLAHRREVFVPVLTMCVAREAGEDPRYFHYSGPQEVGTDVERQWLEKIRPMKTTPEESKFMSTMTAGLSSFTRYHVCYLEKVAYLRKHMNRVKAALLNLILDTTLGQPEPENETPNYNWASLARPETLVDEILFSRANELALRDTTDAMIAYNHERIRQIKALPLHLVTKPKDQYLYACLICIRAICRSVSASVRWELVSQCTNLNRYVSQQQDAAASAHNKVRQPPGSNRYNSGGVGSDGAGAGPAGGDDAPPANRVHRPTSLNDRLRSGGTPPAANFPGATLLNKRISQLSFDE